MRRGGGQGGGSCPPKFGQTVGEIRAEWVKYGQSKKKKSARESYKLTPLECGWWCHTGNVQGSVLVNPFGMSMMTSHRQCPRGGCLWIPLECWWCRHTGNVQGGVCACESLWNVDDDVTQAMSKGGCLWMSKSRGVFQILGGWMTSRGQCPRGGACGYLCKISGKSTPLPPLTKAFPYAYD